MLPIEQCYGIIVFIKEESKFLVLHQGDTKDDSWSFPKGHHENNETPKETALRELDEETGIKEIEFADIPLIHEEYEIMRHGEKRLKVNDYFIGLVKDKSISLKDGEIHEYKWTTFEEALEVFTYKTRKETLKTAQKYIDEYELRK